VVWKAQFLVDCPVQIRWLRSQIRFLLVRRLLFGLSGSAVTLIRRNSMTIPGSWYVADTFFFLLCPFLRPPCKGLCCLWYYRSKIHTKRSLFRFTQIYLCKYSLCMGLQSFFRKFSGFLFFLFFVVMPKCNTVRCFFSFYYC
jgi:hypothetical protein